MSPITVKNRSSLNDLLEGYQLFLKSSPWQKYAFLLSVLSMIHWIIRWANYPERTGSDGLSLIVIIAIITLPAWRWIYAQMMRPSLGKHRDCGQLIFWEFSEDSIKRTHNEKTESMSWLTPHRIIKHPSALILDMGLGRFHYLPERTFASSKDFRKICAYARTHAADFKEIP
ncbi:MAG: hypothetical protein QM680_11695 [Luteolibacter sp.]